MDLLAEGPGRGRGHGRATAGGHHACGMDAPRGVRRARGHGRATTWDAAMPAGRIALQSRAALRAWVGAMFSYRIIVASRMITD
jgi:hypothetical protein